MKSTAHILVSCFYLSACGGKSAHPQERVNSLRTFGVSAQPLVNSPSVEGQPAKTITLTFYAAVPSGSTAKLSPFTDTSGSSGGLSLPVSALSIDSATDSYIDYKAFRLYTAAVKLTVPTAAAFRQAQFRGAQLRYGLTVTTDTDHEDVVGDLVLFPEGASELAWSNPSVDIPAPAINAAVATDSSIDLKASVTNANPENVKLGWFVSNGGVSNRRASATTWKLAKDESGSQTIAVTVHGLKSRGFGLKIMDVQAQ